MCEEVTAPAASPQTWQEDVRTPVAWLATTTDGCPPAAAIVSQLAEFHVGIYERLVTLRLRLNNNQLATTISVYAPTLDAEEDPKEQFYSELDLLLTTVPKENTKEQFYSELDLVLTTVHKEDKLILKKFNIIALEDPNKRTKFQECLSIRLFDLPSADANVEQQLDALKLAIHKACTETIGHTSRKHQDWIGENDGEIQVILGRKIILQVAKLHYFSTEAEGTPAHQSWDPKEDPWH